MHDRFGSDHGFDPLDDRPWEGEGAPGRGPEDASGDDGDAGAGPGAIWPELEDPIRGRTRRSASPSGETPKKVLSAAADVFETRGGLLIQFDLPGVSRDSLEVGVVAGALRIRAVRRLDPPPGARAVHRERAAGRIERILPIPEAFDVTRLEARFRGGVLAVAVPRWTPSGADEALGSGFDGDSDGDRDAEPGVE